jgi:MaoC like domain
MDTRVLYARAALSLVPGASRLPFVAGGGGEMPTGERARLGVRADPEHLGAYAEACGFEAVSPLPATYPHVLAFPLHMELMTDGHFPFAAPGLVHIANHIRVYRPLLASETLDIRVRATPVRPHPRGRVFSLLSEVHAAGKLAWEEESTMLRRGKADQAEGAPSERPLSAIDPAELPSIGEWDVPEGIGRRYAAVSGDVNPIHMHALSARVFGFHSAIAHGMWTKARCVAALGPRLPEAYTVSVEFRRALPLPSRVLLACREHDFAVRSAGEDRSVHLVGRIS